MNVLDVDVERRGAHRIDDCDMKIAVIPPDDSGSVFLPKIDLALPDHLAAPSPRRRPGSSVISGWRCLIYHSSITLQPEVQSPAEDKGARPSMMRPTAEFCWASSGLPAKIISPRSIT